MALTPINIFGNSIAAVNPYITAQRRVNIMYEERTDGDKGTKLIPRDTPGSSLFYNLTLPTYPGRGFWSVGNLAYTVYGNTIYTISQGGVVTSLGTIGTSTGYVAISDNVQQVIFCDGVHGYIWDTVALTLTTITDANFPNTTQSVTFNDGYFIAVSPGTKQYFISSINDGTTWSPYFGTAEAATDNLIALDDLHDTIILWKNTTIEFHVDVGAAPFPYQRQPNTTQTYGLAAFLGRSKINNSMAFLGTNAHGQVQVFLLNGYTPEPISNVDLEAIIQRMPVYSDCIFSALTSDGHELLLATFPTANRTFFYDFNSSVWGEMQTGISEYPIRHYCQYSCPFLTKVLFCDSTTGNIYFFDSTNYTDDGVPRARILVSKMIEVNGNQFIPGRIVFEMATGQTTSLTENATLNVDLSTDNANTWPRTRQLSLGAIGEFQYPRVIIDRLGECRNLTLRLTVTDNVPFILTRAVAEILPGKQ